MQREWKTDVIAVCTDRFERRLVEEISKVRVDMAHLESSLKQEIGNLRQEIASGRFDLLKWCFLFWIGQVIAITGILGVMLRLYRT